jgi:hypothetical protein
MKKLFILFQLAAVPLILAHAITLNQLQFNYNDCRLKYVNKEYHYSFQYPDFMVSDEGEDESGKGIRLSNGEVAIASWVDEKMGDTPQTLWNVLRQNSEIQYVYHYIKDNMLVTIGKKHNGNIIYYKWIFTKQFILSVSMEYPESMKKEMEPIVKKIGDSFSCKTL